MQGKRGTSINVFFCTRTNTLSGVAPEMNGQQSGRERTRNVRSAIASWVSRDQLTRFDKIHSEPFYLIDHDPDEMSACAKFIVSGSTQKVYNVYLKTDRTFRCNCMDHPRCVRNGMVCKHICFVLFRVLRHTNPRFFDRLSLSHEELTVYLNRLECGLHVALEDCTPPSTMPQPQPQTQTQLHQSSFTNPLRMPGPADDCPVCYDLLTDGSELRGCPSCGNAIHLACVRRWLAVTASKTCIMCRSDVWEKFR